MPVAWCVLAAVGFSLTFIACDELLIGSDVPNTPKANLLYFWGEVDRWYGGFCSRQLHDWDSLRAVYASRARGAVSDDSLFSLLSSLAAELDDCHVNISTGTHFYTCSERSTDVWLRGIDPTDFAWFNSSREGHYWYGMLSYGTAYVRLHGLEGSRYLGPDPWTDEWSHSLRKLDSARGLVLDLRDNNGGMPFNLLAIAAPFADRSRAFVVERTRNGPGRCDFGDPYTWSIVPGDFRYTGRVVVLINRRTVSAGELLALALKQVPGVVVVGERSVGAMGMVGIERRMPNGWVFQIPIQDPTSVDGMSLDGVGVEPDIMIGDTLDSTGRDYVLERALEILR